MSALKEQAERLECLLPQLMRRLFTLEPDHPVTELPLAQLRVCSILQSGPRAMSAVGEELGISVSAVTQIADRLERAGLVERVAEVDDRRMKHLQLTSHGAALMCARRDMRVRGVERVLKRLVPEDRDLVIHALEALLEAGAGLPAACEDGDPVGARLEH